MMRVRINGYVEGRSIRGEDYKPASPDQELSLDDIFSRYLLANPGITNIRMKVSDLAKED